MLKPTSSEDAATTALVHQLLTGLKEEGEARDGCLAALQVMCFSISPPPSFSTWRDKGSALRGVERFIGRIDTGTRLRLRSCGMGWKFVCFCRPASRAAAPRARARSVGCWAPPSSRPVRFLSLRAAFSRPRDQLTLCAHWLSRRGEGWCGSPTAHADGGDGEWALFGPPRDAPNGCGPPPPPSPPSPEAKKPPAKKKPAARPKRGAKKAKAAPEPEPEPELEPEPEPQPAPALDPADGWKAEVRVR